MWTRAPLIFLLVNVLLCFPAFPKDMDQKVGVGVSIYNFDSMGSLSLRYHLSPYFSVTGVVGFDTTSANGATLLGLKIYRNAYLEENMNFFVGLAGYILADKGGTSFVTTGVEMDALFGAEFFFSGLPNLGFLFETGIGVRSQRETALTTLGGPLAGLGIHYYF